MDFINEHIAKTTAHLVEMSEEDQEQDCTPLAGSTKLYEFRLHCSVIAQAHSLTLMQNLWYPRQAARAQRTLHMCRMHSK